MAGIACSDMVRDLPSGRRCDRLSGVPRVGGNPKRHAGPPGRDQLRALAAHRQVGRPPWADRDTLLLKAEGKSCGRTTITGRSIALFVAAALAETAGAYLIWVGLRDVKGPLTVVAGAFALVLYRLIAAQQSSVRWGVVALSD